MKEPTRCVDCGKAITPESLRCRQCNGKATQRQYAEDAREADEELLRMKDVEHLSNARIGARLGVSRQWVWRKVTSARRRQKVLRQTS